MNQLVELKRLGHVIRCPPFHRFDGVPHGPVAGDHDGDDAGIPLLGRFDHSRAVDSRQTQVGDQDVEGELVQVFDRLFTRLVVYEQEMRRSLRAKHSANRLTQSLVPTYPARQGRYG